MNLNLKRLVLSGAAMVGMAMAAQAQLVPGAIVLPDTISGTRTLSADSVYQINNTVYVVSGGLISIQAGTLIYGNPTGTRSALVIERGGKIYAPGTVTKPIIFTSPKRQDQKDNGNWGGVIICGNATTNNGTGTIEGGVGSIYGGGDDADSSGVLSYARIEFSGIAFAVNNEINGLTLGAVGNRTKIDHIQVSYNGDDSYEFFGGTVNAKNLIAFAGFDDDFDTDNGYRGRLQFLFGMRDSTKRDQSTSNGMEADNNAAGDGTTPLSNPIISNLTLVGPNYADTTTALSSQWGRAGHWRRNTDYKLFNSVLVGYYEGVRVDGSGMNPTAPQTDLKLQNTVVTGKFQVARSNASGGANTQGAVDAWFTAASSNNFPTTNRGANHSEAGLTAVGQSNLNDPNPIPAVGSPAIGRGVFTDADLAAANNFTFSSNNYAGAFDPSLARNQQWDSTSWSNYKPKTTTYVKYRGGWNLIGLANTATNNDKSVVYPNSTTNASRFSAGYATDNTLDPGVGYWIKLSDNATNEQEGVVRTLPQTINVVAGWNLVSTGASENATVANTTYSGTAATSPYSGFSNGYFTATRLEPGRAYWVKMTAAGTITFNP